MFKLLRKGRSSQRGDGGAAASSSSSIVDDPSSSSTLSKKSNKRSKSHNGIPVSRGTTPSSSSSAPRKSPAGRSSKHSLGLAMLKHKLDGRSGHGGEDRSVITQSTAGSTNNSNKSGLTIYGYYPDNNNKSGKEKKQELPPTFLVPTSSSRSTIPSGSARSSRSSKPVPSEDVPTLLVPSGPVFASKTSEESQLPPITSLMVPQVPAKEAPKIAEPLAPVATPAPLPNALEYRDPKEAIPEEEDSSASSSESAQAEQQEAQQQQQLDFSVFNQVSTTWETLSGFYEFKQQLGEQLLMHLFDCDWSAGERLGITANASQEKMERVSKTLVKMLTDMVLVFDVDSLSQLGRRFALRRDFDMELFPAFCEAIPISLQTIFEENGADFSQEAEDNWTKFLECAQSVIMNEGDV